MQSIDDTRGTQGNVDQKKPTGDTTPNDPSNGVVFSPPKETAEKERPKLNMDAPLSGNLSTPSRRTHQRSVLTNESDMFDIGGAFSGHGVETGTIVTDRRHERIGFRELISSAFKEWVGGVSKKLEKVDLDKMKLLERRERPTISAPENRTETIKEAKQYSKQLPADDHALVVEKIKTLSHDAERITGRPYLIKKDGADGSPQEEPTRVEKPLPSTQPEPVLRGKTLDLRGVSIAPAVAARIETQITGPQPEESKPIQTRSVSPFLERLRKKAKDTHATPVKDTPLKVAPTVEQSIDRLLPEKPLPTESQKQKSEPAVAGGWKFLIDETSKQKSGVPENLPVAPEVPNKPQTVTLPETKPIEHTPLPVPEKPLAESVAKRDMHEPEPRITEPPVPVFHEAEKAAPKMDEEVEPSLHVTKSEVPERRPLVEERPLSSTFRYVLILIILILVGAFGGAGTALYLSKQKGSEPESGVLLQPSLVTVDSIVPLPLPSSRALFGEVFREHIARGESGMSQLSFTAAGGDTVRSATTREIFALLAPHATEKFVRTLDDEMVMGSVLDEKGHPFILLRTRSFDNAFAGMLEWEPHMGEDLLPLFGTELPADSTPVERNRITKSPFIDIFSGNTTIRALKDRAGNELLIYAFVNRSTILITTSTAALSAVIPHVK